MSLSKLAPSPRDPAPPVSIFLSGESYFYAAEHLEREIREGHRKLRFEHQPVYYLYRHGLELAMKAYLRSQGLTDEQLKSKRLRHNLLMLYEESLARKLPLPLDSDFRKFARTVIGLLHAADDAHQFRYVVIGVQQLPDLGAVRHLGSVMFEAIRPYCPGCAQQNVKAEDS
jgi:hypothetical protein